MKVIAAYNLKGGVGKTTTAVNMAYLAGMGGARTLLWDLDPQGGASYYMCIRPKVPGGVKEILQGKLHLSSIVRMTGYPNLDFFPSDLSYREMDHLIAEKHHPTQVLEQIIRPMAKDYDYVFLDCPPGLGALAENVFRVADILLIPLIPSALSLTAYNRLVRFLSDKKPKKLKVMPFFNLVNEDKSMHQVVLKNVLQSHAIFLKTAIPDSSLIEAMGVKRSPLFPYSRDSKEAHIVRALWQEIQERGFLLQPVKHSGK